MLSIEPSIGLICHVVIFPDQISFPGHKWQQSTHFFADSELATRHLWCNDYLYIKRGVENSCPWTQHVHATKSPRHLHSALESLPWSVLKGVTCAIMLLPRSVRRKTRKWPSAISVLWRKYTDFRTQQRRQCRSSGQRCHIQPGMQSTRKPPVQGHSVGSTWGTVNMLVRDKTRLNHQFTQSWIIASLEPIGYPLSYGQVWNLCYLPAASQMRTR